ncbi:hypothetical protein ACFY1B_50495 [Streptomyces mirabilis]|uniref:hypothetical protein n=1 Tax=Streptomyces mirabilis TaxID=68239 RepID=UPI0036C4991E
MRSKCLHGGDGGEHFERVDAELKASVSATGEGEQAGDAHQVAGTDLVEEGVGNVGVLGRAGHDRLVLNVASGGGDQGEAFARLVVRWAAS